MKLRCTEELLDIQGQIAELERKNEDTVAKLADAGSLKALLFEQGDALEEAVLKAMRLIGFSATQIFGIQTQNSTRCWRVLRAAASARLKGGTTRQ